MFDTLAQADHSTLVLILLIAAVAVAFPGWIALYRDIVRARAAKDERADQEVSDSQKAADERQQKVIDGIIASADAVKVMAERFQNAMDLFSRMQDAREEEIGIRKKNSTLIADQAETLSVVAKNLDDTKQRLEVIQAQSKQLDDTKTLLDKIAVDIGKIPEAMQEKLSAELEDIRARLVQ